MIIRVVFWEPAAITISPGPGPRFRNLPDNQRVLIFPCHSIVCSPGTCCTGVSGKCAAQKPSKAFFRARHHSFSATRKKFLWEFFFPLEIVFPG